MDFQKNLYVPNITTNDVYKRQLNVYMFNIHVFSNNDSYFYAYDETIACKGPDEVTSCLNHFINEKLHKEVRHLEIFCDSCAGPNKNWTVIRFLHYIVHFTRRLESVKVTFPIRGHSYLECDRNMIVINQKKWIELPRDWVEEFRIARSKPTPFQEIDVDKNVICGWTDHLQEIYSKKCPFATRPIREMLIESQFSLSLQQRTTFNRHWHKENITKSVNTDAVRQPIMKYNCK